MSAPQGKNKSNTYMPYKPLKTEGADEDEGQTPT